MIKLQTIGDFQAWRSSINLRLKDVECCHASLKDEVYMVKRDLPQDIPPFWRKICDQLINKIDIEINKYYEKNQHIN